MPPASPRGARPLARLFVLIAVAVSLGHAGSAAAFDRKGTELRARKAFAAGEFDPALDLFAQLYAETLHPVYLRNIGRCHQKMQRPQKAMDAFRDYLAKGKAITPAERTEIEGYITEMEELKRQQEAASRPVASPPPPPPSVAPPQAAAEPAAVVVAPEPTEEEPSPFYTRWWFWTGVGVVVVGGVVTALALSGNGEKAPCPAGITCQ